VWEDDEDPIDNVEVLEGGCQSRDMEESERNSIHEFVLMNFVATSAWREEYGNLHTAHEANRSNGGVPFPRFHLWIEQEVELRLAASTDVAHDVALLAKPLASKVHEYPSMWAYGNHYRSKSCLWGSSHAMYDAGIASVIWQTCQSSVRDLNRVRQSSLQNSLCRLLVFEGEHSQMPVVSTGPYGKADHESGQVRILEDEGIRIPGGG
jgi:hypothetical protein